MISKASDFAYDVYDVVSSNYNQGGGMLGGKSITADRLAIVELVRECMLRLADDLTNDEAYALQLAQDAIRAASGDER